MKNFWGIRKSFSLIIVFKISVSLYGQFPGSTDSLYTFIKYNSILRNTVDWKSIDAHYKMNITNAKTLKDTMNCFVSVLEELNDVHSQIYLNNQYYGNYPHFHDTILTWLKPLNDKSLFQTNQIRTEWLLDKIAYVQVPSFQVYDPTQINYYAQSLYDSIIQFNTKKIKGFILDLRLNGGGNIYPMLSGLSPFLDNQIIAYETDINDQISRTWEIKNGNFIIGGYQTTQISIDSTITLNQIPLVVLIGPVTKSSGSMTGIAFKKRPNTIFIGEPTADGYTSSNGYFQFAPNLNLNFATHYVADRNITIYKTNVNPDFTIYRGDDFDHLMQDEKIKAAIQWLLDHK